jgi:hypothetical protein
LIVIYIYSLIKNMDPAMKVSERLARVPVARSFSQTETMRRKVLG